MLDHEETLREADLRLKHALGQAAPRPSSCLWFVRGRLPSIQAILSAHSSWTALLASTLYEQSFFTRCSPDFCFYLLHVHMCVPISSTSRILCVRRSHAQVHNDVLCLLVFVQGYSFIISSSSSIFLAKVSFLRRKTNITHFFFCFFCEKRFILRMN